MSWAIANFIDRGLAADRPSGGAIPGKHYGWFATDTGVLSIWDGAVWIEIGPGAGSAVDSVFGRTGAVVAASGDYSAYYDAVGAAAAAQAASQPLDSDLSTLAALGFPGGTTNFLREDATWATPPGGGGGGFGVAIETPAGTINGSNVTFTLSAAPDPSGDLLLWKNGLFQEQGVDYTLATDTITFAIAPESGSVLVAGLPAAASGDVAGDTHAASSKATPVDLDEIPLVDSAASYALKKLTWANMKATAKAYFDTLYAPVGSVGGTTEYDYVERSTGLTVTATASASAQAFIDGNAVTYDGSTRIKIEFYCADYEIDSGNRLLTTLWDGSTDLGRLLDVSEGSAAAGSVYAARFLTPSAGAHTFHIKMFKTSGTASASGGGSYLPAWYRITAA